MRKKWYKVIEKWEIMGNSGKNCDKEIGDWRSDGARPGGWKLLSPGEGVKRAYHRTKARKH